LVVFKHECAEPETPGYAQPCCICRYRKRRYDAPAWESPEQACGSLITNGYRLDGAADCVGTLRALAQDRSRVHGMGEATCGHE
jgi:hypothetical protein